MNRMTIWPLGHSHGMMEWWWNEVYFRTKGLALNQKYPSFHPHSVIPSSFLNDETDWNEVRMSRMTTEWYPSIVIFIPCHFLAFWNDQGMTEWGGMMVFLEVDKNTEFWDTSHPATIRSFQPHSFVLSHVAIIPSFLSHLYFKTSFGCHLIILNSFCQYTIVPISSHHS